ncbi:MAG: phage major capsid protein [Hyphomicrobiales bacterium]|nr:phage major capsid protein [Hyphomicrobiales bacterium]
MIEHELASSAGVAPEIKASPTPNAEANRAYEGFIRDFAQWREENDRRLAEIEKRGRVDPLTEEKLARLDAAVDESRRLADSLALKQARPRLGLESADGGRLVSERRAAFDAYVRGGSTRGLVSLEEKSLSVGTSTDGGYVAPAELEREVMMRLAQISPIRAIAGNRQVSANVFNKPYSPVGATVGWVAETGTRAQTATQTLQQLSFPTMELYAMPAATQTLLDDAAIDVEAWIAEEVQQAFAEQEGAAFVAGDGSSKPKGFMAYGRVDNASWAWGSLGYVTTGVSGALPTSNPSDKLVDLVYALKSGYRQNATWVMNRKTQAEVRKLKDGQGHYLWQPPAAVGQPSTLMNFPVVEAEDMPVIAADACPIAFGDFRRGYLVVDRLGVRVLRDPYSAKPYVLFYTTKRVGGGVQDFDAIKLLKFGTA